MVTDDNRVHEEHRLHVSDREKTVLHCLITGDSNKTIARKINIAEATVKVYVKTILRKVKVQNRTQAAIWAMQNESIGGQRLDLTHHNEREVGKGSNCLSAVASA